MYRMTWENQSVSVATCEQVEQLLDRLEEGLAGEIAILVLIENESTHDTLKVGVGGSQSVLDYVPGSLEPPYYASLGDSEARGSLIFRFEGEATEIPAKNAVPRDLAREAVRFFCATGQRSPALQWEMD